MDAYCSLYADVTRQAPPGRWRSHDTAEGGNGLTPPLVTTMSGLPLCSDLCTLASDSREPLPEISGPPVQDSSMSAYGTTAYTANLSQSPDNPRACNDQPTGAYTVRIDSPASRHLAAMSPNAARQEAIYRSLVDLERRQGQSLLETQIALDAWMAAPREEKAASKLGGNTSGIPLRESGSSLPKMDSHDSSRVGVKAPETLKARQIADVSSEISRLEKEVRQSRHRQQSRYA